MPVSYNSVISFYSVGAFMQKLLTPRQVAQAIGVSESSLKRWCDRHELPTVRTAGGHRRLQIDGVVEFLRRTGHPLVRPELLGLPSNTGKSPGNAERAVPEMFDALTLGDEERCRRVVFDLFLSGSSVSEICDQVLAPCFHQIGQQWGCGDVEVYQERRACGFCLGILAELRTVIPAPPADAPLAIGASAPGDPYMLPTTMVELVWRQSGWRAQSLGSRVPFESLRVAIENLQPQVFWLSASHLDDPVAFLQQYQAFFREAHPHVAVVVGGRALTGSIRRDMEYAAYCDNLQHLETFIQAWASRPLVSSKLDQAQP